jgi:RNA polymerase-binding transcription factor DksA
MAKKKTTTKKEEEKKKTAKTTKAKTTKTSKTTKTTKKAETNKAVSKTTKKTATKTTTKKSASTKTKKSSKKKEEPQVITTGRITIKRPKRKSDPYVITSATGVVIKGYSPAELEEFKEIIIQRRDEIIEQLRLLKEQMMDPNTGEYINENSPYSLHMAEQGTDAQEREKLFLWAQRESKFLRYLEDALQRIELGTYGICVDCMDEPKKLCPTCPLIPKERLRAVPHTQHCVQVKQQLQK